MGLSGGSSLCRGLSTRSALLLLRRLLLQDKTFLSGVFQSIFDACQDLLPYSSGASEAASTLNEKLQALDEGLQLAKQAQQQIFCSHESIALHGTTFPSCSLL